MPRAGDPSRDRRGDRLRRLPPQQLHDRRQHQRRRRLRLHLTCASCSCSSLVVLGRRPVGTGTAAVGGRGPRDARGQGPGARRPGTRASSSVRRGPTSTATVATPATTSSTAISTTSSGGRARTAASWWRVALVDPYTGTTRSCSPRPTRRRCRSTTSCRCRTRGRRVRRAGSSARRRAFANDPLEPARGRRAHERAEGRRRHRDLAPAAEVVPVPVRGPAGRGEGAVAPLGHAGRARRDGARPVALPGPGGCRLPAGAHAPHRDEARTQPRVP